MFENPRRGRQARNFTTNVSKILDLTSSSEQIFFRKLSLGAPVICSHKRVGVTLQATVKFRLYMGNIMYWGLLTLNIISFFSLFSLACASSKTYNLQRVFLRIYDTNWGKSCQAFLPETVETWKKNRCMIEATHVLRRNIKFRAFPKRVGPRILSLQSVDFFGTSEH